MRQMVRIMWTSMWYGLGRAFACSGMLYGMKIRSTKCRSHQKLAAPRFAVNCSELLAWHLMSKGFQNFCIQTKNVKNTRFSFHSFCNLKYGQQTIIFECGRDQIGCMCRATFAVRQNCHVLHSAAWHSVDAPLELLNFPYQSIGYGQLQLQTACGNSFHGPVPSKVGILKHDTSFLIWSGM